MVVHSSGIAEERSAFSAKRATKFVSDMSIYGYPHLLVVVESSHKKVYGQVCSAARHGYRRFSWQGAPSQRKDKDNHLFGAKWNIGPVCSSQDSSVRQCVNII